MPSLNYEEIFSSFLGDVEDYNLASLSVSDANEEMVEYLHKSLGNPYIRRLFSSLTLDDDIQIMSFEMRNSFDAYSDKEFIISILSKEMVVNWLSPFVYKTSLINQRITSSKESKFYSQAQHLSEMKGLFDDCKLEVRKMIRDRSYILTSYAEES